MACAKHNCSCNTQSFYVNRQCQGYYSTGSSAWKVPSSTISNIAKNKTVRAADINVVKNKVRDLVKKYNTSDKFVAGRGGAIPLTEASNYGTNTVIQNEQYNNIHNMYRGLGGSAVATKHNGDLIIPSDWTTLISRFNTICNNCICNTDCACNTVCSVNADCGCNYS